VSRSAALPVIYHRLLLASSRTMQDWGVVHWWRRRMYLCLHLFIAAPCPSAFWIIWGIQSSNESCFWSIRTGLQFYLKRLATVSSTFLTAALWRVNTTTV